MNNEIYKKNYEFACKRITDFYNYLIKLGYKAKLNYFESYASYFRLSELNEPSILLKDLKCINNSITISTYLVEREFPYYINLWFYTEGDSGHHSKNIEISRELMEDDDFFFKYIIDYINEFMPFKDIEPKIKNKQLSIFDFI